MKKISKAKIAIKAAVVIAIALAFVMPSSTAVTNSVQKICTNQAALNKLLPQSNILSDTDVLISSLNPDEDDLNPKIAMHSDGILVVAYEQVVDSATTTIPVVYSDDDGVSWTMQFDIDFTGYGSGILENVDVKYCFDADEFFFNSADYYADPSMWVMWRIIGDIANAQETTMMGISGTNAGTVYEGAVGYVGDWLLGGALMDFNTPLLDSVPTIGYYDENYEQPPTLPPDSFYFDGQSFIETQKSKNYEIATGTNRIIVVMDHFNDTTQQDEVLFKATVTDLDPESETYLFQSGGGYGGMDKYADIEIWPWYGYLAEDAIDPDVYASGSSIYVVYTQAGDVKCSYSSDDGENWDTSVIATEAGFPSVTVGADAVYCAYVQNGNLFLVSSDDGGVSWGTPEQINDVAGTVVEAEGTADLGPTGIVWTDNRNGDLDVYFDLTGGGLEPKPKLEITINSEFGLGVSAVIKNTGDADADATDVDYTMTITGGILDFIDVEVSDTIATIAEGGEEEISSGMFFGLGAIDITVEATCAESSSDEETAEGTQIIIFTSV